MIDVLFYLFGLLALMVVGAMCYVLFGPTDDVRLRRKATLKSRSDDSDDAR